MHNTTINTLLFFVKIIFYLILLTTSIIQILGQFLACKGDQNCIAVISLSYIASILGISVQGLVILLNLFTIWFVWRTEFTRTEVINMLKISVIETFGVGVLDMAYLGLSIYISVTTVNVIWIISTCLIPFSSSTNLFIFWFIYQKSKTPRPEGDYHKIAVEIKE
jgi:hypothetical protein